LNVNVNVTIVIPTFQESGYLQKTLNFLSSQSIIRSCEIIFVDYDPDNTGQTDSILQNFGGVLPDSRIVKVSQTGIGFARNAGVHQASSSIICNLDGDSHYSDTDGLAKMVNPIVLDEAVMTIPYNEYDDGNPVVDAGIAVSNFVQYVHPFHLTGSCIRTDIILASGGFADENKGDELGNITGYIIERGLPIKIINETTLVKSARRVKALVEKPLTTHFKDFSVAYR
jgi:glycosyltransferase involved in cell wall biosynthesis